MHSEIGSGSTSGGARPGDGRSTGRPSTLTRVALGAVFVVASALVVYPFPLVAAGVAGWWLAHDLGSPRHGRRHPGGLGVAALVLLAVAGALVTSIVVGLETHFDCGGTFGGFGGPGSADVDSACASARRWRAPFTVAAVIGTTVLAGALLRRRMDEGLQNPAEFRGQARPTQHPVLVAVGTIVALTGVWALGVVVFVLP